MEFKTEIFMLLLSIALFAASSLFYYSSEVASGILGAGCAFSFVGCGSVLMVTAAFSYWKKGKKTA
ncbi:MAG: hypothetical protein QXU99_00355 [Candidatus Bathyarchaeia archaeon]